MDPEDYEQHIESQLDQIASTLKKVDGMEPSQRDKEFKKLEKSVRQINHTLDEFELEISMLDRQQHEIFTASYDKLERRYK